MSYQTPILLTGVTGGLGSKILSDLLLIHKVPGKDIIATSRSASNREKFLSQGVQFRVADYKDPSTLETAFQDVGDLLFMSSSERDNAIRDTEHRNVIEAAVKKGIRRVWYVSLAFGGWGQGSKIGFQQAHYETERLLMESGLNFISLRAGIYSDAFPLFLNWYPSSKEVLLPKISPSVEASKIAFTTRSELGEGIATLLARGLETFSSIQPKTERNIILLTSMETDSLPGLVPAISRAMGREVSMKLLEPREWIEKSADDDRGGKSTAWFEARLVITQGVSEGDAKVVDPALETLLGRKPETGAQAVERLITESGGEYRWHQNHFGGKGL